MGRVSRLRITASRHNQLIAALSHQRYLYDWPVGRPLGSWGLRIVGHGFCPDTPSLSEPFISFRAVFHSGRHRSLAHSGPSESPGRGNFTGSVSGSQDTTEIESGTSKATPSPSKPNVRSAASNTKAPSPLTLWPASANHAPFGKTARATRMTFPPRIF